MSEAEKNPLDSPVEHALGHVAPKTVRRKIQTEKPVSENTMDKTPDSNPDSKPDKIPIETTETVSDDVSEDLSEDFQVAAEKLVPERNNKSSLVSGKDLRKEQERSRKMMLVKELLEAGYTVRDVCSELGVKKTLVEKVSKKLRQETASNPRAKYLEKPFADKLREMEAAEGEDSLLSGNWLTQTYQRLAKMRVEFSMMKKMGLIEDDGGSASSQRIDINSILIAKALGNNGGNKELIELIAAFKQIGVLGTPQTDNFMEKYAAMENIKDAAVQKNTQITTAAYSAAKSESDKNFAKELVGKAIETFSPVLKNIATKPVNIPSPTPEGIPGPLMPPSQSELESLSLNLPSLQHVPVAEPAETWPVARTVQGGVPVEDTIGYTNINRPQDFGKKTQLR